MTSSTEQASRCSRPSGYGVVVDALGRESPVRDEVLAALALFAGLRADLDALESGAIDAARRCGAGWAEIALALGLRSRQAAEQRRLRLGTREGRDVGEVRERRRRQREADATAGTTIVALREAVTALAAAIDRTPDWDGQGPAAMLARRSLRIALDAEPGALVDLAQLIVGDLATLGHPPTGGPPVQDALRRTRDLVSEALTAGDSTTGRQEIRQPTRLERSPLKPGGRCCARSRVDLGNTLTSVDSGSVARSASSAPR
jgi:hypothetical protein